MKAGIGLVLPPALLSASRADPTDLRDAVLATPGPGSSESAIPELAVRIGADRGADLALRLKFVNGGGIAIREIYNGNAQFGVLGATAAMYENLHGPRLVALVAIEDRAPLSLMVRADLKSVVHSVTDLRGRVLGVHSNSLTTMTNGQKFLNLVLRWNGIAPEAVRHVAAGQSWDTQSSALRSRVIDAVVSEEPIATRLERDGLVFPLVRLGLAGRPAGLPGEGFLRAALIAQPELVRDQPKLAERMVRAMQTTLAWRRDHGPEEIVAALGLAGAEADAFATMLRQYPNQFSTDGRFSESQIEQTDVFFRESTGNEPEAVRYRFDSMIVDRWAGRKP